MANKDYYSILGVDRNASEEQIKAAYKKLALKWHPDRHANESEAKKKEAEERFKEIAEAYAVLSDEEKKAKYDRFGSIEGMPDMDFSGGFGGFGDIFDIFRGRSSGRRGYSENHEPGATIELRVPLSIEEIYNGGNKTVDYDSQIRCGHCHGSGKTVKNVCHECGGTGTKKQHKTITINIPKGVQNGQQQTITGAGYESKDPRDRMVIWLSHLYMLLIRISIVSMVLLCMNL